VLSENGAMLQMCGELGFRIARDREDPAIMMATLALAR
jgi:hypothetical protein